MSDISAGSNGGSGNGGKGSALSVSAVKSATIPFLVAVGIFGLYIFQFISSLESRFVTAPVFDARMKALEKTMDSVQASTRDIPRLSAQLESLQRDMLRIERENQKKQSE